MRVIEVNGDKGIVDIGGVRREIDLSLVEGVKPGNWVILHAGFAIQVLDEEEARETLELLSKG